MNTRKFTDSKANLLQAGDNHYRSYVGPPKQYDLLGAMQFRLLVSLGLREWHKVLDFGCGSLRAGRLFIPYLNSGCYFGVDPNDWLIKDAIDLQIGQDLVRIKRPIFSHNNDFTVPFDDVSFDFIIAQSIFSHTGMDVIEKLLEEFSKALNPTGIAAVTFSLNQEGPDYSGDGWVYPKCVRYRVESILNVACQVNLNIIKIPFFHPRQTWFLMSHKSELLPSKNQLKFLHGAVLNVAEFAESLNES